ncbi:MAG TPA: TIM barrel protein [Gemmatimonadales bacterium]
MKRRDAIGLLAGMVAFSTRPTAGGLRSMGHGQRPAASLPPGRLKQSVSYWPYARIPLPDFARECAKLGLAGVDLLQPEEWPVVRDAGLVCSMGYASKRRDFLSSGFNDPSKHDMLVEELERTLPLAAAAGVPNLIAMFGNRKGMPDEEGAANCIAGLRRVAPSAERHGVTICVELLNSKVDHKDYMGDHTAFGVRVMEGVASPRVKLLYDIYHMQIMEGDVIRTIRDNFVHLGHFHTGGVPGRHELDDTQELNWRAVCRAIADKGFTGYLAHEFMPTRDPLTSLREAVALCTVGE